MLKVRVIPLLLIQDGLLKKPVQFKNPRTISDPITVIRVFEERQVDELILLDIGCSSENEDIESDLITDIARELSVPFTFGGGVDSLEKMQDIIRAGAEKIVINSAAVENPTLITEGALHFGSQCIVVSIDVLKVDNTYEVFIKNGSKPTGLDPIQWAIKVESLGAGEILINSIAHDGMLTGYDIDLITRITNAVNIPVIAAGGASSLKDCVEVIKKGKASAIAAGSIFHFTKFTPNMIKGILNDSGISVRMYNDVNYAYR